MGMSSVLPKSFIDLFMFVVIRYFKKKIFVSKKTWEAFIKNKRFSKYREYFKMEEELETAYFEMPYSFVMGIFNYLSSLLHSFNQKEAMENIIRRVKKKYDIDIEFEMQAHSDDSGGYLIIFSNNNSKIAEILNFVLTQYEIELKLCNHMLSIKKCVVSEIYSEVLSILYVNGKLLPLIPKFFGNMAFKPTLEGYAADQSLSYGKCIELLQNGATFSEAFFNMKVYSEMVRDFYGLSYASNKPISALGTPNSHPILVLMLGAMSDEARLFNTDKKQYFNYINAVRFLSGQEYSDVKSKPFKEHFFIKQRNSVEKICDEIVKKYEITGLLDKEIIADCTVKTTVLQPLSFLHKCKDRSFNASLSYESNVRRLTRIFSNKSKQNKVTVFGYNSYFEIQSLLELAAHHESFRDIEQSDVLNNFIKKYKEQPPIDYEESFGFYMRDATAVYDYLDSSISENVEITNSYMSCKPIHLCLTTDVPLLNIKEKLEEIYYSDHEDFYLTSPRKELVKEKEKVCEFLERLSADPNNKNNFVFFGRKAIKSAETEMFLYGYIDSSHRLIQDYYDLFHYIETNTFPNKKITRIYSKALARFQMIEFRDKFVPRVLNNLITLKFFDYCNKRNFDKSDVLHKETGLTLDNFEEIAKKSFVSWVKHFSKSYLNCLRTLRNENLIWICWVKKQVRVGLKWAGYGSFQINIFSSKFIVYIRNSEVTHMEANSPTDDTQLLMLFKCILGTQKLKVSQNVSPEDDSYAYGSVNGVDKIAKCYELENVYCPCQILNNLNLCVDDTDCLKPAKKDGTFNVLNKPYRIETLLSLLEIPFSEIENLFEFRKEGNIREIFKNFIYSSPAHIETDKEAPFEKLVDNITKTHLYHCFIYSKLEQKNYDLNICLSEYCRENKIQYTPVSEVRLEELLEMNVEWRTLPKSVLQALMSYYRERFIEDNLKEIVSDFAEIYSTDFKEKNWNNFLSDWGGDAYQMAFTIRNTMLPEFLRDPLILVSSYPEKSQGCLETIRELLFDLLPKGLSYLYKKEQSVFNTKVMMTKSDLETLLQSGYYNSSNWDVYTDYFSVIIQELFSTIFNDIELFKSFYEGVKKNDLLRAVPIDETKHSDWARLFIVCNCSLRALQGVYTPAKIFKMQKTSRFRSKGKAISSGVPYKKDFGMFKEYEKKTFSFFRKKSMYELILKNVEYKDSRVFPFCFFPKWKNIKKAIETEQDEDVVEGLEEIEAEFDGTLESREACSEFFDVLDDCENQPSNPNKKTSVTVSENDFRYKRYGEKVEVEIEEAPFLKIVSTFKIDCIAYNHHKFCIMCSTLPDDILLQNSERVKVYLLKRKPNEAIQSFFITYNLNCREELRSNYFTRLHLAQVKGIIENVKHPLKYFYDDDTGKYIEVTKENSYKLHNKITEFKNKIYKAKEVKANVLSTTNKVAVSILEESNLHDTPFIMTKEEMIMYRKIYKRIEEFKKEKDTTNSHEKLLGVLIAICEILRKGKCKYIVDHYTELKKAIDLKYNVDYDIGRFIDDVSKMPDYMCDMMCISLCEKINPITTEEKLAYAISNLHKYDLKVFNMVNMDINRAAKETITESNVKKMIQFSKSDVKYSPISKDEILYKEFKCLFGEDAEFLLDRNSCLTSTQKEKLKYVADGIFKKLKRFSEIEPPKAQKYIYCFMFVYKVIESSKIVEDRSETEPFYKCFDNFFEKLMKSLESVKEVPISFDALVYEAPSIEKLDEFDYYRDA